MNAGSRPDARTAGSAVRQKGPQTGTADWSVAVHVPAEPRLASWGELTFIAPIVSAGGIIVPSYEPDSVPAIITVVPLYVYAPLEIVAVNTFEGQSSWPLRSAVKLPP
jgi:hypothetical protein